MKVIIFTTTACAFHHFNNYLSDKGKLPKTPDTEDERKTIVDFDNSALETGLMSFLSLCVFFLVIVVNYT